MHTWANGSPETCIPGPLPGSTASEQYIIAISSSIHQQQPDGEPQLGQGGSWVDLNDPNSQIAGVPAPRLQLPGSEFTSMPVSSNPNPTPHAFSSEDPDDKSGGPIVPAGLPVMLPQTPQDNFNKFLEVSDKCGLPRCAYDIVWPKVGARTHPTDITRIMERSRANIDQQFIDRHSIKANWNKQIAPLCICIAKFCTETGGYCTDMPNHLGACIVMMLKHHKDLI